MNVGFYANNGGDVATEEKKLSDLMAQDIRFGGFDCTDKERELLKADAESTYGDRQKISVYCSDDQGQGVGLYQWSIRTSDGMDYVATSHFVCRTGAQAF